MKLPLILICAFPLLLSAQEQQERISRPILLAGEWIAPYPDLVSYTLTFTGDGHYIRICNGECGQNIHGNPTYKIDQEHNLVHLSADPATSELFNLATTCKYTYDPLALEYRRNLSCDNLLTYRDFKSKSLDIQTVYRDTRVVTMGVVPAVTTDSVRLRPTPSISSAPLKFSGLRPGAFIGLGPVPEKDILTLDYLPVGTQVTILARTLEKEQVNQWHNYWYLIKYWDYKSGEQTCWAFAEFLKKMN